MGRVMRTPLVAVALLVAVVVGRLTVPDPPPRIERVKETVMISAPAPTCPVLPPKGRATLEDVRRDWKITGRLVCHTEIP